MSDAHREALLRAALEMAGRGIPVFPLWPGTKIAVWHRPDRCPRTGACVEGHVTPEDLATLDPDRIRWRWGDRPWNVGVFPGPAGRIVVDCDQPKTGTGPDGWDQLQTLAVERGGPLPDTWTVTTPSGGRHLWFRVPPGCRLRGTVKHIAPHVDTRCWGTYALAPGCVFEGGAYELFDDASEAEFPGWLIQANVEHASTAISGSGDKPVKAPDAFAAAAVRGETDRVRREPKGQRNKVLSTAAYALGQLVGAHVLDEHLARTELQAAVAAWNTPESRVKDHGVIETSLAAGARNPRRITGKAA
ncbi:bifunctional DNA primase/polymerase [Amycolatopsis japonica]|uniref:bifunctional DNA primase/polymerase n=1 Tax=Amycolatopsis japonica TaxID=208439 RepID=UPI00366F3C81